MVPLVAIELSKQHSRFPNESIVVIISPLIALQWLSITSDLQRKNVWTKPKVCWTSIVSTSLPTVCKIYKGSLKPCSGGRPNKEITGKSNNPEDRDRESNRGDQINVG